nr:PQQ-dependent sugar dehydrogenase [Spelaeibacter cavernicola]
MAFATLIATGCARFDDSASSPFSPAPSFNSGGDLNPNGPKPPPTSSTPPKRPTGPCIDPDPNVVATCLDTTGGLVVMPDGQSALVAERRTGRILQVAPEKPPVEIAKLDVDASSDGGLLDLALSPTFGEDGLIYAYITTGSDNRVVRIAQGDVPKDVLTGIPKGATGNGGSIDFANPNEMLVLTGDAGNPDAANDPASLSGKLLRVNPNVGPDPKTPQVALSGIGVAGDVCTEPGGNIWVTDRTATEDRLQKVDKNGVVVSPAWTWPDRPGVAGCAVSAGAVAISLTGAKAVAIVPVDPGTGAVTAAPSLVAQDKYGQLGGAGLGPDGTLWASTVNKTGGQPGPNDDRVVKIPVPAGGGGSD